MTRINMEDKKTLWLGSKDRHYDTHYDTDYDAEKETIWHTRHYDTHKINTPMKKN